MDELAKYNKERWEGLAQANVAYSRPFLDLDRDQARAEVDPFGLLGDVAGKDVLCLAAGGGQQSAAFGLLGAAVTVLDLSETQLASDRQAAAHYGLETTTVQGDMRDLSRFGDLSFDIVWHAHSINFIPDVRPVLREAARVLRPGGFYHVAWNNPFTQTVDDNSWNGEGYLLKHPFRDGAETSALFPTWDVQDDDGTHHVLPGPREFVHAVSTVINTLADLGFVILRFTEYAGDADNLEPGSWEHYMAVVAPYLNLWCVFRPDLLD